MDSPDEGEVEKRAKQIVSKREQGPTTASQTESYRFFDQQAAVLGQPYDVTHIPIDVLDIMQRDPMIAFGLHFKKVPLMRARWHIKSEDARIASFIDNALRSIYPRLVAQFYRSRPFGFSPVVKRFEQDFPDWTYIDTRESDAEIPVWSEGNIPAIVWKNFTPLPCNPEYTVPKFNAKGEFNGIEFTPKASMTNVPTMRAYLKQDGTQVIPASHALWFTNERDSVDGSMWGYPATGYVYRYWWSYWYRWALYDRFFERKSDPPYLVYYPDGSTGGDYLDAEEGEEIGKSMQQIALNLAINAKSGGAVALPSQTYVDGQDRPGTVREWEISELEVNGDMSQFIDSFEYLDVMKLRGLFIPEQALIEGAKGQSSRNVAATQADILTQAQASDIDELDDIINNFIIPDLLKVNFPESNAKAIKVTTGFTEADMNTMKEVIQAVSQSDTSIMEEIDIPEMLERIGLPRVSRSEMLAKEEKIVKEMEKLGPEVVVAEAGQSAGVNEQGLYYQPREQIKLAEDIEFLESLPDTKHYKDVGVKAGTRQLRGLWKNEFDEIYSDFSRYLRQVDINEFTDDVALAEIDPDSLVGKIMAGWQYSRERIEALSERTGAILKRVMGVAARQELATASLPNNFNVDSQTVEDFLSERGALYVQAVDQTTKRELGTFLANGLADGKDIPQIAAEISEHFEGFSDMRANRLVRSEIRDAYNFSMLEAADESGIRVVQAHDANLGESVSDPECINRDGRFFTIEQAKQESLKEHPNGTLYWTLTTRDNLSEQIVSEMPEQYEDALAYFDDTTDTIYIHEDISDEAKSEYLNSLGVIFENENL